MAISKGTTAVLDACVLFGMRTTDILMTMALFRLFQARWTPEIDQEWMDAVMRDKRATEQKVCYRRDCMRAAILDWEVENVARIDLAISLPDAQDDHVLKAAIAAESDWIVTFNLRDFPRKILDPYKVRAIHPDDFLLGLASNSTDAFLEAISNSIGSNTKPPLSITEYLESVRSSGLTNLAIYLDKTLF